MPFSLGEKLLLALLQRPGEQLTLREVMAEKQALFGDDTDHGTGAAVARLAYLAREGYVIAVQPSPGKATRYSLATRKV